MAWWYTSRVILRDPNPVTMEVLLGPHGGADLITVSPITISGGGFYTQPHTAVAFKINEIKQLYDSADSNRPGQPWPSWAIVSVTISEWEGRSGDARFPSFISFQFEGGTGEYP